jgi:hypothetical protein
LASTILARARSTFPIARATATEHQRCDRRDDDQ